MSNKNNRQVIVSNLLWTNTVKYFFILCITLFALVACNNKKENIEPVNPALVESTTTATKKIEAQDEETPTIATLTAEQIQTVGIQYGSIEQKQLTATMKVNGHLKVPNNNKANATSLYGGVIKTIRIEVGSYVRKGQEIATIANPQFIQLQEEYLQIKTQTGLGSADATSVVTSPQYGSIQEELRTIEPKLKMAELEVARQIELNAGNAGALKNLQQARTDVAVLKSRRTVLQGQQSAFGKTTNASTLTRKKSIETQLQLMGINPSSVNNNNFRSTLSVLSPISGTISNVFSKIGSYVDVSSPVAEIVDNGQLHLDLNVFEKDLPMLRVGQTIHFTLTNNPTVEYDAQVFSIGSSFENESKTISIHCDVKGNKNGLIDGMNITAIVSLNDVTTAAVPSEAIVEADGKYFIFIVTDKKPEEHHEESEAANHKEQESKGNVNFEKIEVVKGVTNIGFTAVSFVTDIAKEAKIVTKGAYFINAKLTNTEE